jgi:hypothetical protein
MAYNWLNRVEQHARTAGAIAGAAHTAFQVGKAIHGAASYILPLAAALL